MVRSVGCPATVDGQVGASAIAGLRVGEHERGASELAGRGRQAQRALAGQETQIYHTVTS